VGLLLPFEQKVTLWLYKNYWWIWILLTVGLVGWGGRQVHRWTRGWIEEKALTRLAGMGSLEERVVWAEDKKLPGSLLELSGLIELQAGHEAYRREKFTEAVKRYQTAVGRLAPGSFLTLAKRGYAFATLQANQRSEAEGMLKGMVIDESMAIPDRVWALSTLAFLAYENHDLSKIKEYKKQLEVLDANSLFRRELEIMERRLNPDKDIKPPTSPEESSPPI
jgi:hypothetical protein